MIAVCTTHYRLPRKRLDDFVSWNHSAMIACGGECYVTTDVPWSGFSDCVVPLPYPIALDVFNISKTSNYAIRAAIDAGQFLIVKTDIDCVLTPEFFSQVISFVRPGAGMVARYAMVNRSDERPGELHPKLVGTTALHSDDWEKLCGYRETMTGYGWDDADLNRRASKAKISMRTCAYPVYHVAHNPGSPQIEKRKDQWNRDGFNPMNRVANMKQKDRPWNKPDWGRP